MLPGFPTLGERECSFDWIPLLLRGRTLVKISPGSCLHSVGGPSLQKFPLEHVWRWLWRICLVWWLSSLLSLLPAWRKSGEEESWDIFVSQKITVTFSSRWQKFSQLVQFFIPANPRISGLCSLSSVCMQPSRVFPWAISYSSYSGQSAGKRSAFRHLLIIPALSGPFSVFWFAASNSYNKCFTTV